MYPCFQGYIRLVSLLFPLICPRKVIHKGLYQWTCSRNYYCHNVYKWMIIQHCIYAKTVHRIHTLHSHTQSCVCWCMCVSVLNKNPNWCAGIKCKTYSIYVGKSKYSMAWRERQLPFCGMQKFLWLPDKSRTP